LRWCVPIPMMALSRWSALLQSLAFTTQHGRI
jgi:hypothetical protein